MRRLVLIAAMLVAGTAAADPAHDEMAAALVAQIDAHPSPIALPVTAQAPQHAASHSAVKQGFAAKAAAAQAHADEARAQGQANAAANKAQAAANAAAGQAQSNAAKERAQQHPHPPHPTH